MTIPFAPTVAIVASDEEYVILLDRVTSRMLPSEKVANTIIGDFSPITSKLTPGNSVERETGMSGLSTSIRIVGDCALCPEAVAPTAVSM